jgi:hypothetical protein
VVTAKVAKLDIDQANSIYDMIACEKAFCLAVNGGQRVHIMEDKRAIAELRTVAVTRKRNRGGLRQKRLRGKAFAFIVLRAHTDSRRNEIYRSTRNSRTCGKRNRGFPSWINV